VLATSVARHSFKSCNIFCCLLLQVPTQFAWLDILLKSVSQQPCCERCVFYTPSVFCQHFFEKRFFRKLMFSATSLSASNVGRILDIYLRGSRAIFNVFIRLYRFPSNVNKHNTIKPKFV